MSDVMMKALQIQVESLTRQVKQLAPENEQVRQLLTDFTERHMSDEARIAAQDAEIARLREDPNAVHANMLRGTIAKPTWVQIEHLYPEDVARLRAERDAAVEEAKIAHAQAFSAGWDAGQADGHEAAAKIVDPAPNAKRGLWSENLRRKAAAIRAITPPEETTP